MVFPESGNLLELICELALVAALPAAKRSPLLGEELADRFCVFVKQVVSLKLCEKIITHGCCPMRR